MIDFFAAIEPSSPQIIPFAAGPHNPFSQMAFGSQQMGQFPIQPTGQMQTGVPMHANPFGIQNLQPPSHQPFSSFLSSQPTELSQGNLQPGPSGSSAFPQTMATQTSPFGLLQQSQPNPFQQPQATGLPPLSPGQSHLRPQPSGLLQPQATGANPFRQSMFPAQNTGAAMFGVGPPNGHGSSNPFGSYNQMGVQPYGQSQSAGPVSTFPSSVQPFGQPQSTAPTSSFPSTVSSSAFTPLGHRNADLPARPSSTPLTSGPSSSTTIPQAQPVQTHQTGSRNPFGPIIKTPPPVPKAPTLMELSMGLHNTTPGSTISTAGQLRPSSPQSASATNTFSFSASALNPGPTDMASVASSFTFSKVNGTNGASSHAAEASSPTSSTSNSLFSSTLSTQPTGATSVSNGTSHFNTTTRFQPVKSHTTGFTSLKPFKPTSSFGAALLESLPPIPDNAPAPTNNTQFHATSPTTPSSASIGPFGQANQVAVNPQATGAFGPFSPTASTLGQGLRPQMTGGGASNPFRASMMSPTMTGLPNVPSLPSPTTPGLGLGSPSSFASPRVPSTGMHLFGAGGGGLVANTNSQPQQQNNRSLI